MRICGYFPLYYNALSIMLAMENKKGTLGATQEREWGAEVSPVSGSYAPDRPSEPRLKHQLRYPQARNKKGPPYGIEQFIHHSACS